MKRICCVLGHSGSGKTEFALNYAVKARDLGRKVVLCDLDVINPYFRSRERQEMLENLGIRIYSNAFGYDISEDLPAVSAQLRAPFDHSDWVGIYDVGGDRMGAAILNQYKKELAREEVDYLLVVNGNRQETETLEGVLFHLRQMETDMGISFTGLVNNTHLMDETTEGDVWKGVNLCKEVEENTGIPLRYTMVTEEIFQKIIKKPQNNTMNLYFFTVKLFLKSSWLPKM
jgi:hypothetical protein